MNARPVRTIAALVIAVTATWFVARPAFGTGGRPGVEWQTAMKDGPYDLAADAAGIVVTTSEHSVYALNPDGRVQWWVPVDDLILGQPAVSADLAVVGGMHSVTALARANG